MKAIIITVFWFSENAPNEGRFCENREEEQRNEMRELRPEQQPTVPNSRC